MSQRTTHVSDVGARLERIERLIEARANKLQDLESRIEDLETDDREAAAEREALREDLIEVKESLAGLDGLAESHTSTPAARARDLVIALRRQAEAGDGKARKDYREVINALETLDHGTVYPAQAYDAMETAAKHVRGVSTGTEGDKQVVRFNADRHDGEVVVRDD